MFRPMRSCVRTGISLTAFGGFLAVAALAAVMRFGSVEQALIYFGGKRLLVSSLHVSLGSVKQGSSVDFVITLKNETSETVSILGLDDCCSCELLTRGPVSLRAFEATQLQVRCLARGMPGEAFAQRVAIATTSPDDRPMISFGGTISP